MILGRLLSAQPTTDMEKWRLKFQVHKDIWHTDAYGQNPAPFYRQPGLSPRLGPPFPWHPGGAAGDIHDAIWPFPSLESFDLELNTDSYPAQIAIYGNVPVNVPTAGSPAQVPLQASTANTGGSIKPGTYLIAVALTGLAGPVSTFASVAVPAGTNTNTVTLTGVVWPSGTYSGWSVYIGTSVMDMNSVPGSIFCTGSAPDANGNPTTILIPLAPSGFGMPDQNFNSFLVQEYAIQHGGVWGDSIYSWSGTALTFGGGWTVNQWAGYTLSLYYRPGSGSSQQPILSRKVISNTSTVLTMDYTGFQTGDVVVLRAAAAHITTTTIGDDNFVNSYAPSGLDVTGTEKGRLVQIIAGTGAGQPPKTIQSNTATVFTLAQPWDITPDATSVWIVTDPTAVYEYATKSINNAGLGGIAGLVVAVATTPAVTSNAQSLLIEVATCDKDGNCFPMRYQPFRELYVPPQNTSGSDGPVYTISPSAGAFTPDLSRGINQRIVLTADAVIHAPTGAAASTSLTWTLIVDQDSTGGWSLILDPAYFFNGTLSNPASPPKTRCQANWVLDQAGKNSISGLPSVNQPIPV
jgi:hypothetical protein